MKELFNKKDISSRFSVISACIGILVTVIFCIYAAVYDYFDIVVLICFVLGIALSVLYVMKASKVSELFNLLSVLCYSFGVGLFFLNSYPVWADRLNHISMYGSRGTLLPVVTIMLLTFAAAITGMISCFARKEKI